MHILFAIGCFIHFMFALAVALFVPFIGIPYLLLLILYRISH